MNFERFLSTWRIASLCLLFSVPVWAAEDGGGVRTIEPDKKVEEAEYAAIDSELFEIGAYVGSLSVEDFGSDVVSGIELNYHLAADWMLQLNYGKASIDRAAFESEQREFLADSDRYFEYVSAAAGFRLLRGRAFLGSRHKYNSDIYFFAGPERVSFAGNKERGLVFALSYRLVLADWLTANIDVHEHVFERTFIGESKHTLNTEFRVGLSWLL